VEAIRRSEEVKAQQVEQIRRAEEVKARDVRAQQVEAIRRSEEVKAQQVEQIRGSEDSPRAIEMPAGAQKEVLPMLVSPDDYPNVLIDDSLEPGILQALFRELERTAHGATIADRIRDGEVHITLTREPIGGMAGWQRGRDVQVAWQGSIEETASKLIHEGAHFIDNPFEGEVGASPLQREGIARTFEYEYRQVAGLTPYDEAEEAYRQAYSRALAETGNVGKARQAADLALLTAMRADPQRFAVESSGEPASPRPAAAKQPKDPLATKEGPHGARKPGSQSRYKDDDIRNERLNETDKVSEGQRALDRPEPSGDSDLPGAKPGSVSPKALARAEEFHHLLVRELRAWFEARGLNIDDRTVKLSADEHRWIHNEHNWNARWKEFMRENQDASPVQMFMKLDQFMEEVGLRGLKIVPYPRSNAGKK
jgi:hypothetical protein